MRLLSALILTGAMLAAGTSSTTVPAQSIDRIVTIGPSGANDRRYEYQTDLLDMVLARTVDRYGAYELVELPYPVTRNRALQMLIAGEDLHVQGEASKPDWTEALNVVRIPIRKGIQGYRLFLIEESSQPALSQVTSLDELREFPTGSGAQWSTRRILEEAGFTVVTAPNYEGLFHMLALGRFATFSRGLNEVFQELDAHADSLPQLSIETDLALFIPLPTYFFVCPNRPDLAERIEAGLRDMIADGSFDAFFLEHHAAMIARAGLEDRLVFSLDNPNITDDPALEDESLWFRVPQDNSS